MSLHRKLLMLAILAVFIPNLIGAQEKQSKFEITYKSKTVVEWY